MTKEEFVSSLKKSHSAPFLFIGSGFTRHYLGTPDWKGMLSRFAPKHINQYYSTEGTDNLPSIASAIAKDINTDFWKLPDDDAFKIENQDKAINQSSIFKIKIAQYLKELSLKDFPKQYLEELDLLAKINIDGIITTNWDDTAERIFPKFTRYVGQQELFFAPTFGMSEIYKIHGCISRPESLVLTEEDYNDFNNRNTYLAAKLITIFVEHPIIFLGYSIADNNIQAILRSVVSCFQKDNLQRLQHNLIFVEWNPNEKADFKIDSYGITLEQGTILPVTRINTHDFKPVYECLSYFERSIPANLLREYKKQFYNIVVSQNPEKTLYALPDTKIDGNPDIQVVYGFGAISKFQSAVGYTGIKAINLLKDVIEDTYNYDALQIVTQTIPELSRTSPKAFIPIYKYFSALGIHSNEEYSRNQLGLSLSLRILEDFQAYKSFSNSDKRKRLQDVIDEFTGQETWKAIALIPYLNIDGSDLEILRNYIARHLNDFLIKWNNHSTFMRKLICFYDWKKYGWE